MTGQKNIPGIITIEYAIKTSVNSNQFWTKHSQVDPNYLINGAFTLIEFVKGSATLKETVKSHRAGDYYEVELSFSIAGISHEITQLLDNLRAGDILYRAVDPQSQGYLIGSSHQKVRFEYQVSNSPNPSGSRGYQCKITLKSTSGLLYCI